MEGTTKGSAKGKEGLAKRDRMHPDHTARAIFKSVDTGERSVGHNDKEAIPNDLLIADSSHPVSDLIDFVYPSILENYKNPGYLQERVILASKDEVVQEINDCMLSVFPGDKKEYLSADTICQSEYLHDTHGFLYPPEYLWSLKHPGLPNHQLVLKVGVPVILLRDINPSKGFCNGTRLRVIRLDRLVIQAESISGSNIGTSILIPRMPSEFLTPVNFKRTQFPLAVCFAMPINKSQGMSFSRVGLFLKEPDFMRGQLDLALSRVKSKDGLKLLILDKDGKVTKSDIKCGI